MDGVSPQAYDRHVMPSRRRPGRRAGVDRDSSSESSTAPRALVLEGEAGMGKTTLWRAGVEHARPSTGFRVLQAQPAESETALSFAGLGDLLDRVLDEALAPLPAAQARALCARARARRRRGSGAGSARGRGRSPQRASRAGSRAIGRRRRRRRAVARRGVVAARSRYAARRLRAEHVGVLLARRRRLESSLLDELRRSLGARSLRRGRGRAARPRGAAPRRAEQLGVVLPRPAPGRGASGVGREPVLRARDRAHAAALGRVRRGRTAAPGARVAPRPRPRPSAGAAAGEP